MMPDAVPTSEASARSVVHLRLLMSVALLAVFSYGFFEGRTYVPDASRLPVVVCAAGAVFAVVMLFADLRQLLRSPAEEEPVPIARVEPDADEAIGDIVREGVHAGDDALGLAAVAVGMRWFAWIGLLVVLIALLGMLAASVIFVAAFLLVEAKASWRAVAISAAGLVLVLGFGSYAIGMNLPDGLLLPGLLGIDELAYYIGL